MKEKQFSRLWIVEAEKQERIEVHRFIRDRGVRLFHFTAVENLAQILSQGLIARVNGAMFNSLGSAIINDPVRDSFAPNCLSIGHPNYKLMRYWQDQRNFVVLEFDCDLLAQRDVDWKATPTNSRLKIVQDILENDPEQFSNMRGIQSLFLDRVRTERGDVFLRNSKEWSLPDGLPSDPQAEIITDFTIAPHWINFVHFRNAVQLRDVRAMVSDESAILKVLDQQARVSPGYFEPRPDWRFWQSNRIKVPLERARTGRVR